MTRLGGSENRHGVARDRYLRFRVILSSRMATTARNPLDHASVSRTPSRLRPLALVGLALLAGYYVACFREALGKPAPPAPWARQWPWLGWFGSWDFFTRLDERVTIIGAEARYDGRWTRIPLEDLFPTRWDSGPRYHAGYARERSSSPFFLDSERMKVLGAATCGRLPEPPTEVRFFQLTWKRRPGTASHDPPRNARRSELSRFVCGTPVHLPGGWRL